MTRVTLVEQLGRSCQFLSPFVSFFFLLLFGLVREGDTRGNDKYASNNVGLIKFTMQM